MHLGHTLYNRLPIELPKKKAKTSNLIQNIEYRKNEFKSLGGLWERVYKKLLIPQ